MFLCNRLKGNKWMKSVGAATRRHAASRRQASQGGVTSLPSASSDHNEQH